MELYSGQRIVFRFRRTYDHFLFRLSCSSTSNRIRSVHVNATCLIHITHFLLSRCGLGEGMKYAAFCSLSGYRLSVLHVPQEHNLTMFIIFYTNNINPSLNCYIMPTPCCIQWSFPSRCPSIVEAGMSLAHLRSKGGAKQQVSPIYW